MTTTSPNVPQTSLADFSGLLVLAGAGKMGGAMLEGWCALGLDPAKVAVIDPQPSAAILLLAQRGLRVNPKANQIGNSATLIVIAVKPQVAADLVPNLAALVGPHTAVLSIMAGKTLKSLEQALPASTAIVRAMPNTPAAIGRGMTVAVPNAHVNEPQRELVDRLITATGAIEWVDDEGLLDAVTAVSGSGPAYVFLLAEALARAGIVAGLPDVLAARLARATVEGAGELLHRSPLDPAMLRQNVTSPGGTTAAALDILAAKDGLAPLMERAVAAATRRSRDLAG